MSDYASLWSLISASPHYLKAFLGSRNSLLTRTTLRELTTRGVILCNRSTRPVAVSDQVITSVAVLNVHNIEWLDYKVKGGVEHTVTLQINLHAALQTYYSQIESNSSLCLEVQQLKALRTLEDVVTWLRFDPELRIYYSQVKSTLPISKDVDRLSTWCVSMRESTFESYMDVNNLDVLHNYHPWIKGGRTESEIRPARIALAWLSRKAGILQKQLDELEAFQRYFPWCDITTVPGLIAYESRVRNFLPSLNFLFACTEFTKVILLY